MDITHKKCTDADDAARAAGNAVSLYLSEHTEEEILLLVSGGSAFDVLHHIDRGVLGSHITLNVVDERFDVDKEDQNFYQLSQLPFARDFIAAGGKLCDAQINDAADITEAGEFLERCIADFMTQSPKGKIVTLLGVGDDGHTVGVMPHPAEEKYFTQTFVETERLAIGYDAVSKNLLPLRATVTLSFLQHHVDYAVVYAVGEKKSEALRAMTHADVSLHKTPAGIVQHMKEVVLCTDHIV